MKFTKTEIEGLIIVEPTVFKDERGYFFEAYNKKLFQENGIRTDFVQDNLSMSQKDVLRGLHFQTPPHAQAKLVSVLQGAVLDVAVDLRKNSASYGKHISIVLSAENRKMFYIPEGFAHGFLALEEQTVFSYKCSKLYNKSSEDAIMWNDPSLGIDWGIAAPILSLKDQEAKEFETYETPFQ